MKIQLNGEQRELGEGRSLSDLIDSLGLRPERLAVEVNGRIIRRANWASTTLVEGDKVEVVHFVGGGSCRAS